MLVIAARRLFHRQALRHLTNMLSRLHSADAAYVIQHLDSPEGQVMAFDCLPNDELRGQVLSELDEKTREHIANSLSPSRILQILKSLGTDDVADVLGGLPEEQRVQVLALMDQEDSAEVKDLLQYEEGTAGSIMTTEVLSLPQDVTAAEAIRHLQEETDAETAFYIYVTDKDNRLTGVLSLRRLLMDPPSTPLEAMMTRHTVSVTPDMDQEEVARLVAAYNLLAIPVVDQNKALLGIITVDDVVDVMSEEATEDMLIMAGAPDEGAFLYSSVPSAARARFPWLFTNLLGTFLSGALLWYFRFTLQEAVALVSFIPVISAMGGNVGLQTSMLVVRGLAVGQIGPGDLWAVWRHELAIGLCLGLVSGLLVMVVGWLWQGHTMLGVVVGVSLLLAFLVSTSLASMLPIVFNRFQIDPAVAAGPFVSTTMDIVGIAIYLTLATSLLTYLV
ncbi:MAG: magnesium transporter [Nitrospira sp.]|nr:magnesium transporter [Nitrospira sp.]